MAGTTFPMYVIDAFPTGNNDVFTGGPAAIVILQYDDEISDDAKQKLATSMNLSETAYVSLAWTKPESGGAEVNGDINDESKTIKRTLRWFTPAEEVPLCGHATQASAKAVLKHFQILNNTEELLLNRIDFDTKFKGTLSATFRKEKNMELITISLPANPTVGIDIGKATWAPNFLKHLLGPAFPDPMAAVQDLQVAPDQAHYLLVRLKRVEGEKPEVTLRRVAPSSQGILESDTSPVDVHLTMVTIEGEGGGSSPDFYCRIFCPYFGVPEDPVCGSAQTLLTSYWTRELKKEGQALKIRQLSPRGGQSLGLRDRNVVTLTGTARVVIEGVLKL